MHNLYIKFFDQNVIYLVIILQFLSTTYESNRGSKPIKLAVLTWPDIEADLVRPRRSETPAARKLKIVI